MDNYKIATLLRRSLEKGSSPLVTIIVSLLIKSAVGILLDTRNAATISKPNVACVTTVLK